MRMSGVILFSLALGAFLAQPAPVAADTVSWDYICSNSLSTCSSVEVAINTGGSITISVENLSAAPLTSIGLSGSALSGLSQVQITGWAPSPGWVGSLSVQNGTLQLTSLSGGLWSGGGLGTFVISFAGTLPGDGINVETLNGYAAFDESSGSGPGLPGADSGPTTHAPEPATFLLLGTGLAGIAIARRRHTGIEKEET